MRERHIPARLFASPAKATRTHPACFSLILTDMTVSGLADDRTGANGAEIFEQGGSPSRAKWPGWAAHAGRTAAGPERAGWPIHWAVGAKHAGARAEHWAPPAHRPARAHRTRAARAGPHSSSEHPRGWGPFENAYEAHYYQHTFADRSILGRKTAVYIGSCSSEQMGASPLQPIPGGPPGPGPPPQGPIPPRPIIGCIPIGGMSPGGPSRNLWSIGDTGEVARRYERSQTQAVLLRRVNSRPSLISARIRVRAAVSCSCFSLACV